MKNPIRTFLDFFDGLVASREKFIFTTLARILAICCIMGAAYFAWKLTGQLRMQ